MRPSTLAIIILLATAIVLSCLTVQAYTVLDFVIFDGIEYLLTGGVTLPPEFRATLERHPGE